MSAGSTFECAIADVYMQVPQIHSFRQPMNVQHWGDILFSTPDSRHEQQQHMPADHLFSPVDGAVISPTVFGGR